MRTDRQACVDMSQSPPDFAVVTEEQDVELRLSADVAANIVHKLFEEGLCVWFEWEYDKLPVVARYATHEELPFVDTEKPCVS